MSEIKKLKGYQNSNPDLSGDGITIGQKGIPYNILNLDLIESKISIETIAHSLARQCRYMGNIRAKENYSVAQHSYLMAFSALLIGEPLLAKAALLHDGGESIYFGDISSPAKQLIKHVVITKDGKTYKQIEDEIDELIMNYFDIPYPIDPRVKTMDMNIAQFEMTTLMASGESNDMGLYTDCWSVEKAEKMFLEMFNIIEYFLDNFYATTPLT